MGKIIRKRGGVDVVDSHKTRSYRDEARRRRAEAVERARTEGKPARKPRPGRTSFEDRPPAPWGNFPLVELCILIGIILLVAGFVVRGERGITMVIGGMALASLGGLELSIREHIAGFRSHTTLLSGAIALGAMAVTYFTAREQVVVLLVGVTVFLGAFLVMRQVFVRRSGGVSFKR